MKDMTINNDNYEENMNFFNLITSKDNIQFNLDDKKILIAINIPMNNFNMINFTLDIDKMIYYLLYIYHYQSIIYYGS